MGSFAASANTSFLLGSNTPVPSGTANGVLYLNGSKVPTSGSALQFSGTALTVNLDGTSLVVGTGGASTTAASFRSTTRNQLRFPSGASFEWHEGVNELMRLNSTGLGIGTNNPQYKLDVSGAIRATGDGSNVGLYITTSAIRQNVNGGGFYLDANSLGAPGGIYFRDGNGFLTRMLIDASGNLGLGVTPSAANVPTLQLANNGAIYSYSNAPTFAANSYYNAGNRYITTGIAATAYQQVAGSHLWLIAPSGTAGNAISFTQAMTLDSSGRLGIGTTNPIYKFEVNGTSNTVGAALRGAYNADAIGYYFAPDAVTGNSYAFLASASVTSNLLVDVRNQNNASATANTTLRAAVAGSGGGDARAQFTVPGSIDWTLGVDNSDGDSFKISASADLGSVDCLIVDTNKNVVVNSAAIATNATNGFLYTPSCAGAPTGAPTAYTGRIPMVVDTTNLRVYFNIGGTWRYATLT